MATLKMLLKDKNAKTSLLDKLGAEGFDVEAPPDEAFKNLGDRDIATLENLTMHEKMVLKIVVKQLAQGSAAATHRVVTAPAGAVMPICEKLADGSKRTVGTIVLFAKNGYALTARHSVVWDGKVYPRQLYVAEDVRLQHVVSFRDLDITVFHLTKGSPGSGGAGSPSSSIGSPRWSVGSPSGSTGSCGSNDTFPHIPPVSEDEFVRVQCGVNVTLLGYPLALEKEGLLQGPLSTHGRVSHYTRGFEEGIADYTSFPNESGGAVIEMENGRLLGIHIAVVTHDEREVEPVEELLAINEMGHEIVCEEDVEEQVQAGARKPRKGGRKKKQSLAKIPERVKTLEVHEPHKAAVGLFVPWLTIAQRLRGAGILPPSEYKRAARVAKRARR